MAGYSLHKHCKWERDAEKVWKWCLESKRNPQLFRVPEIRYIFKVKMWQGLSLAQEREAHYRGQSTHQSPLRPDMELQGLISYLKDFNLVLPQYYFTMPTHPLLEWMGNIYTVPLCVGGTYFAFGFFMG